MTPFRRHPLYTGALLIASLALLGSCQHTNDGAQAAAPSSDRIPATPQGVAGGTRIEVTLANSISSESAQPGDTWHGTLTENVPTTNGGVIVAGSPVDGVVEHALGAQAGSRAMLELAVRRISVEGRYERIPANAEPVIAGSTRARNLGAIAGGAAAGALIGKGVGDGHNSAIGGLIGGLAATGVVARSKGYQVVLTDGTVMSFTVAQTVAMR